VRFWDSSAVVPLVVRQPASPDVGGWLAEDEVMVTWTLTAVDVISALRRLIPEGALPERASREAEALAAEILRRAHVVSDVERVKGLGARLLRIHPLRAGDALQLGAALAWARGSGAAHARPAACGGGRAGGPPGRPARLTASARGDRRPSFMGRAWMAWPLDPFVVAPGGVGSRG